MLFTSFLFTSFLALVKYGNIDQIRQKLYYHWCDREEKLLLFPEFVSRSARFLKVMRETAVHSCSPFPVLGSRFPVPGFSNILSKAASLTIFPPFTSLQTIPLIDSFLADSFLGQSTGPFIPSGASQPMGIFRSLRERKKPFWGAFRAGATSSLFCRAL